MIVWPAVPEPVPIVYVERECIQCAAPLPAPTGPGRPRLRCERCRLEPIVDWQRPLSPPEDDGRAPPWLTEELAPAPMPWE